MALLGFQQITSLGTAVGLGFTNTPGAYSAVTAYSAGDIVTSDGLTYVAIQSTTGNAPPNATYWLQIDGATNGFPVGTRTVVVQAMTQSVRWRADGIDPTTTAGLLIPDSLTVFNQTTFSTQSAFAVSLPSVKVIETAGSASMQVLYYS